MKIRLETINHPMNQLLQFTNTKADLTIYIKNK